MVKYGTEYISYTNENYPKKSPCNIKFIRKEVEDTKKYIHIGTCISTLSPSYKINNAVENNAFEAIRKCACDKGGDIVKIIKHEENIVHEMTFYGEVSYVAHDGITGEVYVIDEN